MTPEEIIQPKDELAHKMMKKFGALRLKQVKQHLSTSSNVIKRLLTAINTVASSPSSCPPSGVGQQSSSITASSAKRKSFDDKYGKSSTNDEPATIKQHKPAVEQQYPHKVGDDVILGPGGTKVHIKSYDSISWDSPGLATRQILDFLFTANVLATHTLTGKPSPAFYGRERPPKLQLDPVKVGDIIHCVSTKLNCTKREIRGAITTKCSDTSKKFRRRWLYKMQAIEREQPTNWI